MTNRLIGREVHLMTSASGGCSTKLALRMLRSACYHEVASVPLSHTQRRAVGHRPMKSKLSLVRANPSGRMEWTLPDLSLALCFTQGLGPRPPLTESQKTGKGSPIEAPRPGLVQEVSETVSKQSQKKSQKKGCFETLETLSRLFRTGAGFGSPGQDFSKGRAGPKTSGLT